MEPRGDTTQALLMVEALQLGLTRLGIYPPTNLHSLPPYGMFRRRIFAPVERQVPALTVEELLQEPTVGQRPWLWMQVKLLP